MAFEEPEYSKSLADLFKALDAAPIGGEKSILESENDKEYYETQIMYAVRKRAAAEYHIERVISIQKEEDSRLKKTESRLKKDFKELAKEHRNSNLMSYHVYSFRDAHEFVHELTAFLAALRSGVDFVACVAMLSMPGVNGNSITAIVKSSEKNSLSGPIVDDIMAHSEWIAGLKDYRDEVIHRLVVQAPVSGWNVSHKGKTSAQNIPVVVPQHTPKKFVPDTRRARAMDQGVPHGLFRQESYGAVTCPDGAVKVNEHSVEYHAAEGYVPIEEFMCQYLSDYDSFVHTVVKALTTSKFEPVKLSRKK